jgi:phosphate/sulfate permease
MRKPDAKDLAFKFYPPLVAFTIFLNLFLIVYHGTGATKNLSLGEALALSLLPGVLAASIIQFILLPKLRAEADAAVQDSGGGQGLMAADGLELSSPTVDLPDDGPGGDGQANGGMASSDAEASAGSDGDTAQAKAMRESIARDANAEVFDPKAEWVFRYLQVFTACFMSLAHGANDVANSIGPYAAVVALYTTCSRYAHTDWCVKTFGHATYDPVTHSCSCDEGYYLESDYFIYPFETDKEGKFSYQYYSDGTCGDADVGDGDQPVRQGAMCVPRQLNSGPGASTESALNLNGLDYDKALETIQTQLMPLPADAFQGTAPVLCTSSSTPVPEWIFVLGGLGIVAGLALYGQKILIAMGVKMTKITPSRGFAIDISAAFIVVVGSRIGLPLSTTHCKVGATVGVGLTEGKGQVNTDFVYKIVIGWVVTLAITGSCSAAMFYVMMWALGVPL